MNTKETLNLFNEKYLKLSRSSLIQYVKEKGLKLSWEFVNNRPKDDHKAPGEQAIDGFVLNLRFFIQNNEPTSISNIEKAYKKMENQNLLGCISENRKILNEFLDTDFPFKINENRLTNREIMDGFVYSQIAHSNKSRHQPFVKCYESTNTITQKLIEHQFVAVCLVIFRILGCIYNVNIEAIQKS